MGALGGGKRRIIVRASRHFARVKPKIGSGHIRTRLSWPLCTRPCLCNPPAQSLRGFLLNTHCFQNNSSPFAPTQVPRVSEGPSDSRHLLVPNIFPITIPNCACPFTAMPRSGAPFVPETSRKDVRIVENFMAVPIPPDHRSRRHVVKTFCPDV